jgi:glycosyltransferase involved in cell wall biosynthesis
MMRLLSLATLDPETSQPRCGMAAVGRWRALAGTGALDLRVVAPRGWRTPPQPAAAEAEQPEQVLGRPVLHPALPLGALRFAPLFAAALGPVLRELRSGFPFDLIDAQGLYPEGAAAVALAERFKVPFTVTVPGGDLERPGWLVRRAVRRVVARAAGLVAPTPEVRELLLGLGARPEQLRLLPDGVDLRLFRPGDRAAARLRLGFHGPTLLGVGPFRGRRGEELAVAALAQLPEVEQLVLVGGGGGRAALADIAHQLGVARRLRMVGAVPQAALPELYRAADAVVVTGARFGWPASVLEALACGTPVVAGGDAGAGAILARPEAGRLVAHATAEKLAEAIAAVLAAPPSRAATRALAESFDWKESAAGQVGLFAAIVGAGKRPLAA